MSPKARFQMFLDPEQLDALRARQVETGVPVAEQIRRAIDAALPGRQLPKKTARKRAATRRRA